MLQVLILVLKGFDVAADGRLAPPEGVVSPLSEPWGTPITCQFNDSSLCCLKLLADLPDGFNAALPDALCEGRK